MSSGIGKAVAISPSKFGAKVILMGRNRANLEDTLKQLNGDGHLFYEFDFFNVDAIKGFVKTNFKNITLNGIVRLCWDVTNRSFFVFILLYQKN